MIKHPGPSPDFSQWCVKKKIKWLGIDAVSQDHPMNTIQRLWHPKTFEEANRKLIETLARIGTRCSRWTSTTRIPT